MAYKPDTDIKPFEKKIWLSSPTMHGDELKYMQEAYETNWMSTVGANINEVERITCEKIGCGYAVALSSGTAALHLAIKLASERLYGQPKANHGTLEGHKVFCSDMTFDANQLMRATVPAIQQAAKTILECHRAEECDKMLMPFKEIIRLIPTED